MNSEFVAAAIFLFTLYAAGAVIGTVVAQIIYIHRTKRRGSLWVPLVGLVSAGVRHMSGSNTWEGRRGQDPLNAGRPSWPVH